MLETRNGICPGRLRKLKELFMGFFGSLCYNLKTSSGHGRYEAGEPYREKVLVRDFRTSNILERMPGSIWTMPDGRKWILV